MALRSGWYVDQRDSDHEVYWDGEAWTNARRPVAHAEYPSTPPAAPPVDDESDVFHPDQSSSARAALDVRDMQAADDSSYPPQPPTRTQARWSIPWGAAVGGAIIGMIIGGLGVGAIVAIRENNAQASAAEQAQAEKAALANLFPKAVKNCNADRQYAVISDADHTLTIDNKGDEDYLGGLSSSAMWCIIELLGAPSSAMSHMEQTTARDGRQTETWDNIEVSWSYHPDRGMDAIFTIVD